LKFRRETCLCRELPRREDRVLGRTDVVGKRRAVFHRDENRGVAALAHKFLRERMERRGLAHLPRRVDDEVRELVDERAHARQPSLGHAGSGRVEVARHRAEHTPAPAGERGAVEARASRAESYRPDRNPMR
jgi:hypothetical protein